MSTSRIPFAVVAAALAVLPGYARAASAPVLVELFTSQGCGDCPPADALILELASRKDVVTLTLPITYWDMLGWKDTLATEANTRRQRSYAKAMSRTGVYTPQIVVAGSNHVIGSDPGRVFAAINQAMQAEFVPIAITHGVNQVTVSIAAGSPGNAEGATIWLMHTLGHARVAVGGGENNKQDLAYVNVVRELQRIGIWDGGEKVFTIPMRAVAGKQDSVAIVLQRAEHGRVIGAALADLR